MILEMLAVSFLVLPPLLFVRTRMPHFCFCLVRIKMSLLMNRLDDLLIHLWMLKDKHLCVG